MNMKIKEQKKRTFDEVVNLLENEYTMSIKDGCKRLKCSRPWFNKYVKPYCDFIYLNSGIREDIPDSTGQMNWVRYVARLIGRDEMTESTWLCNADVETVIYNAIQKVTRQTIKIPADYLIQDHDKFIKEYNSLSEELKTLNENIQKNKDKNKFMEWMEKSRERDLLFYKYLTDNGKELLKKQVKITERTKAEPVEVKLPDAPINEWVAPHDLKGYGDTDESVYRQFFREGYIRVECQFVAPATGEIGKKIYYIRDNERLIPRIELPSEMKEYITVPYQNWIEMKDCFII